MGRPKRKPPDKSTLSLPRVLLCANTPPRADYRHDLGQTGENVWFQMASACLSLHPLGLFPCSAFVPLTTSLSLPQAPSTQTAKPRTLSHTAHLLSSTLRLPQIQGRRSSSPSQSALTRDRISSRKPFSAPWFPLTVGRHRFWWIR